MNTKIEEIHLSLINGQRRQMVELIDEYGLYDFFAEYKGYLSDLMENIDGAYSYFSDATISYFRTKNK